MSHPGYSGHSGKPNLRISSWEEYTKNATPCNIEHNYSYQVWSNQVCEKQVNKELGHKKMFGPIYEYESKIF